MRSALVLLAALVMLLGEVTLRAQIDPVERARQQEAEENQRRTNARLQALEEALQAIQQEMNALRNEIRNLRRDAPQADAVDQAALRKLEDKVREIDRKRLDDNEKIMSALLKVQRIAAPSRGGQTESPAASGKTYEYKIREGDYLYKIVSDLREQGLQVTQDAVKKANPKTDWNRLQIGSTIVIPLPDK